MADSTRAEPDLPTPSLLSEVAFWFAVWSAGHPDFDVRARSVADPELDPWGYLAALGDELLALEDRGPLRP